MSFVIKEKIKNHDLNETDYFDIVPYNYIFNRTTPFLDKDLFGKDHEALEYVCKQMLKVDKDSLV
jgi:hypothetical protein